MVVAVGTGFCFAKFVHLRSFNKKSMVLSRTQFNFHLYRCMLFSLLVLGKLLGLHTEIIILVASTDLKKCKYPYLTRKLLAFKQKVARVRIYSRTSLLLYLQMLYLGAILLLSLSYSMDGSFMNVIDSKACSCVVNHILGHLLYMN